MTEVPTATVAPTAVPTRLTTDEMLAAIQSCEALAWSFARKFHRINPAIQITELYNVALVGLKVAALNYNPTREAKPGVVAKFSTVAYFCVRNELIHFCRNESARGMHVPTDHDPYFAPAPARSDSAALRLFVDRRATSPVNELGDDFWRSATRTLCRDEREVILGMFRDGNTQAVVGAKLGISRARVSQVYLRALKKLQVREDLKELAGVAA